MNMLPQKTTKDLTSLQEQILKRLDKKYSTYITEIKIIRSCNNKRYSYNTIRKNMRILVDKGLVIERQSSSNPLRKIYWGK